MQKILKLDKCIDLYNMKSLQSQKYSRDISNDIKQRDVLQNKLIAPKSYFSCKSLPDWASDLRSAIQEIYRNGRKLKCATQIAEIYNHATTIFMALDNYIFAREICYSQIQLFTNWSKRINSIHLLKYVFQPWLHLIQLNRLEGNIHDALDKLNALNLTKQPEVIMGENKLLTKMLYQSLHQDAVLYNNFVLQSVIERAKLCFESRKYTEFITFIENKRFAFTGLQEITILEALAVAYANSGKIHEAFSILGYNKANINTAKDPVLTLREFELQLSLGFDCSMPNVLALLYDTSLSLMNANKIESYHITYILHAANVMKMAALTDESVKLVYFCLEASIKLDDEVLKAESLIMLYDYVVNPEGKKIIEDLMITHYYHTQYASVRKKMLCCFKDLKHVETKYHYDVMTPLYEDLLAFDIYQ